VIRYLLRQLCEGLKVLHDLNVVHRDLKPQNLLIDFKDNDSTNIANMRLKIGDFGLARFIQPQDMAATLCGSPLYMAPEILRYQSYDARADLWSLGIILYEMVYGKLPYTGANHIQLAENIQKTTPNFPTTVQLTSSPVGTLSSVSTDCINLISSLLKKKPTDRITFEELLAHPFLQKPDTISTDGIPVPRSSNINMPKMESSQYQQSANSSFSQQRRSSLSTSNSAIPPQSSSALSCSLSKRRQSNNHPDRTSPQHQQSPHNFMPGLSHSPPNLQLSSSPLHPSHTPPSPILQHIPSTPSTHTPPTQSHLSAQSNSNSIHYNNKAFDYPQPNAQLFSSSSTRAPANLSPSPPLHPMLSDTNRSLSTSISPANHHSSSNNTASIEKEYVLVDQQLSSSTNANMAPSKATAAVLSSSYGEKALHITVPSSEASSRIINISNTPPNGITPLPSPLPLDSGTTNTSTGAKFQFKLNNI
jgi:serine/threonine protein kinase